jgi:hypothetical protein
MLCKNHSKYAYLVLRLVDFCIALKIIIIDRFESKNWAAKLYSIWIIFITAYLVFPKYTQLS